MLCSLMGAMKHSDIDTSFGWAMAYFYGTCSCLDPRGNATFINKVSPKTILHVCWVYPMWPSWMLCQWPPWKMIKKRCTFVIQQTFRLTLQAHTAATISRLLSFLVRPVKSLNRSITKCRISVYTLSSLALLDHSLVLISRETKVSVGCLLALSHHLRK